MASLEELSAYTGVAAPVQLSSLREKAVRFAQVVDSDNMMEQVLHFA